MAYRAAKSGINRDVQEKINAKYDAELAKTCLEWMNTVSENDDLISNTDGSADNVHEQLKDGYALTQVLEKLQPGSFKPAMLSKRATMAFKQMEILEIFNKKCKEYGVSDSEVFQVPDLYERQNMHQVIINLQSLARKASQKGHVGFGPKESAESKREFSEDTLRKGEGIIGLQAGSNKGASQSGQTFGARRHITDNF